jgi:hypothetical protein
MKNKNQLQRKILFPTAVYFKDVANAKELNKYLFKEIKKWRKADPEGEKMWSGVYYIKVPKNSGKLFLEDPRPGPNTHMPRREPNLPEQLWRVCAYEPLEGRMIFFPSWLPHGVDINMNTDKGEKNWRISVSYNFIQI